MPIYYYLFGILVKIHRPFDGTQILRLTNFNVLTLNVFQESNFFPKLIPQIQL